MILIFGTVRIAPGTLDRVRSAMEEMIGASRTEDGCLHYSYAVDVLDETIIHISEAWRNRAALDAHFETAHLAQWRAQFASLGITNRKLKLYETDEGEPI